MNGRIILIASKGRNNEIGKDGQLMFNSTIDMRWFRDLTKDHTVVMGRKTYEDTGILPCRNNIVLTTNEAMYNSRLNVSQTEYDKLHFCKSIQGLRDEIYSIVNVEKKDVYIIGGESLYKEFINDAQILYITEVNKFFDDADTFFPEIDIDLFSMDFYTTWMCSKGTEYRFVKYVRRTK